MVRDFDSEIAAAEARIGELQGQLAIHRQQFLEAAAAYMAEWFDATARQFAREQGAVTESLQGERLATLKADVEALKQRAPRLVEEQLNRPEHWYDLGASGYWLDVSRERLPRELEGGMRVIAGQLTGLLERSGYQQPSPTHSGQFHWMRWEHSSSRSDRIVPPAGSGSFTIWDAPMDPRFLEPLRTYGRLSGNLSDARRGLAELHREKSEAAAGDIWDRA